MFYGLFFMLNEFGLCKFMRHLQHVNTIAIGKNGKNKDSLIVYLEKVESHYFL